MQDVFNNSHGSLLQCLLTYQVQNHGEQKLGFYWQNKTEYQNLRTAKTPVAGRVILVQMQLLLKTILLSICRAATCVLSRSFQDHRRQTRDNWWCSAARHQFPASISSSR